MKWIASVLLGISGLTFNSAVLAQIVPDASLPNNSLVTPVGNTFTIDGGTTAGGNLFHSFREFSVPTGTEAVFNNGGKITNIINRVTGGNISIIEGLIRANGTANFFLINPSGIIFGANAKLNVGGSFVASTASSIRFADGTEFSAVNPSAPPLLAINVPVGLQYGSAGSIQVKGSNLQVNQGTTLALVGGNVSIDAAKILALGGRVELGGLAATGTVGINFNGTDNSLSLSFDNAIAKADVSIDNATKIDVAAGNGGTITINARNVDILARSFLCAGIGASSDCGTSGSALGSVGAQAGDVTINATGTVTFRDVGVIFNQVNAGATGNAGNINVIAGSLYLINGSQLFTSTFGRGNAGEVNINAREQVSFEGVTSNGIASGAFSSVAPGGIGNAGSVNITTESLSLQGGAGVFASTFGTGNAGSVNINARERISIDGGNGIGNSSGVFSTVQEGAIGNGGSINITTRSLSLTNSAVLSARTFEGGNSGNIIVTADVMDAIAGAQVLTTSYDIGAAGNITLNVSDQITLSGSNPNYFVWLAQRGENAIDNVSQASGLFANTTANSTGEGGNITITTGELIMRDSAQAFVNSQGSGDAGSLEVTADSIYLQRGAMSADTLAGQGNISLRSPLLVLRDRSRISTNSRGINNVGGNITIDTTNLVGIPRENSDISANAADSRGGNVTINTSAIFGIEFRHRPTALSDITATSGLGAAFSGTVSITTPEVGAKAGLVELNSTPIDTSNQVIVGCAATQGNSFTITGRGGLPEDPTATIAIAREQSVWEDLQDYVSLNEPAHISSPNRQSQKSSPPVQIVEATGWIVNKLGQIELVANLPDQTRLLPEPNCHDLPKLR